jgi:hypothetical protein
MLPLGHIAGIPVEETALSFGPVLLASGGVIGLKARERWARIRRRREPEKGQKPPLRRERPTA